MAIVIKPGFISGIADNPTDLANGLLTPSRHNLPCTITGLTANALLLSDGTDLTQDATNLLYTTASGPRLQVGSGTTTSIGWQIGYNGISGYASLVATGYAVSSANAALYTSALANGGDTVLNAPAGKAYLAVGNVLKAYVAGTAGHGFYITAGTATTDVNALSATQTWNAAGVAFTGIKYTITDTASAAGSLALQILGGAAGATTLFALNKAGQIEVPVGSSTAPAIFGTGGTDTGFHFSGGVPSVAQGGNLKAQFAPAGIQIAEGTILGWGFGANTAFSRISAGLIGVGTGAAGSFAGRLKLTSAIAAGVAVGSLNAAPTTGEIQSVTDALAPAAGAAVSAGGAAKALVWYNGANWTVIGI